MKPDIQCHVVVFLYLTVLLPIAVYEDTFEKIKFKVEKEEKARGKMHNIISRKCYSEDIVH